MLSLQEIRRRLDRHRPELIGAAEQQAAVALVLHETRSGPELLLIERARREGDPWSGQMALPGGRRDDGDPDLVATAARETEEEVGVSLASAPLLGRLDDQSGRRAGRPLDLVIAGFAFELAERPALTLNHEVETAFWVPLADLADPTRWVEYRYPPYPEQTFPGVVVGDPERHVVWGLTFRILGHFFDALDVHFPRWP